MTAHVIVGEDRGGGGARSARRPKKRRNRRVVRVARVELAREPQEEEGGPGSSGEDDIPAYGRCCNCGTPGWFAMHCEECGSESGAVCVDNY